MAQQPQRSPIRRRKPEATTDRWSLLLTPLLAPLLAPPPSAAPAARRVPAAPPPMVSPGAMAGSGAFRGVGCQIRSLSKQPCHSRRPPFAPAHSTYAVLTLFPIVEQRPSDAASAPRAPPASTRPGPVPAPKQLTGAAMALLRQAGSLRAAPGLCARWGVLRSEVPRCHGRGARPSPSTGGQAATGACHQPAFTRNPPTGPRQWSARRWCSRRRCAAATPRMHAPPPCRRSPAAPQP